MNHKFPESFYACVFMRPVEWAVLDGYSHNFPKFSLPMVQDVLLCFHLPVTFWTGSC